MSKDKFDAMWSQQSGFMRLLTEKRGFPEFPLDLSTKENQQFLKKIMHECMGELFEANQHLKNSKAHRATNVPDIERSEYVEELVDALHYFFEICIFSGVSSEEIFDAYIAKGIKNENRIRDGY